MKKKEDIFMYDTRTIGKRIERQELTKEDYEKHLDSLSECTEYEVLDESMLMGDSARKAAKEADSDFDSDSDSDSDSLPESEE